MRLDQYLVEQGKFLSRSSASDHIKRGFVYIDGVKIVKPAKDIKGTEAIEIRKQDSFVSRGGEKLAAALDYFKIDPKNVRVLDIGSSTGGFSDCLLRRDAAKIVAVDVGRDQFYPTLRSDPRIELFENTDIRGFTVTEPFGLIVADLSFISIALILPKISELLSLGGTALLLIKPQFEVGKENFSRDGIVKDRELREGVLNNIKEKAEEHHFTVVGSVESPITGGSGNIEFFLCLKKERR